MFKRRIETIIYYHKNELRTNWLLILNWNWILDENRQNRIGFQTKDKNSTVILIFAMLLLSENGRQ